MARRGIIIAAIVIAVAICITFALLVASQKPQVATPATHRISAKLACPEWPQVSVEYARNFKLKRIGPHYLLLVDSEGQRFILVPRGCPPPRNVTNARVIYVPVRRVVYFSSTEVALLYRIAEYTHNYSLLRTVIGICFRSIWLPVVKQLVANNTIRFMGFSWNPNFELIVASKPDVVVLYTGLPQMEQVYNKLRNYNLTVLVDNEWLEHSFLARFEWIKFIGALYGPKYLKAANEIFNKVKLTYEKIISEAKNLPKVRFAWLTVYAGRIWVPRVDSYVVKTLSNMSGIYVFNATTLAGTGATTISPEFVSARIVNADVIVISSWPPWTKSLDDVAQIVQTLPKSRAVKLHRTFMLHPSYWQLGYAYTDKLLIDLFSLLHPLQAVKLFPSHLRRFFIYVYFSNYREKIGKVRPITLTWEGYYIILRDLDGRTILLTPWGVKPSNVKYNELIEIPSKVYLSPKCFIAIQNVTQIKPLFGRVVFKLSSLREISTVNGTVIVDYREVSLVPKHIKAKIVVIDCGDRSQELKVLLLILGYYDLSYMLS